MRRRRSEKRKRITDYKMTINEEEERKRKERMDERKGRAMKILNNPQQLHCKKGLAIFPSPAGRSLTRLSLAGNNLFIPCHGEFGKSHPGWGRENR